MPTVGGGGSTPNTDEICNVCFKDLELCDCEIIGYDADGFPIKKPKLSTGAGGILIPGGSGSKDD